MPEVSELGVQSQAASGSWRSALFPADWTPGFESDGKFLHDFSYAGYHLGEADPPVGKTLGSVYDITDYGADPSGSSDSTAEIQAAIDAAGDAGGGVVFIPKGQYKIAPGDASYALRINKSKVVLRGEGPESRLFTTQLQMRSKKLIHVRGVTAAGWYPSTEDSPRAILQDLTKPTRSIPVANNDDLEPGDWVVVRSSATDAFLSEHLSDWVGEGDTLKGSAFLRRVVAKSAQKITIDIPTRYYLKTRDEARVYKVGAPLTEVGLENFAIGMKPHSVTPSVHADPDQQNTPQYDMHASHAIVMERVADSWVDHVTTYHVGGGNYHLLSNGIMVEQCRSLTLQNNRFSRPQFEGGGGNGYMYVIQSSDSLFRDNVAESGRHNYSFKYMHATGNVLFRGEGRDSYAASDFHMFLSAANLVDGMSMYKDYWQAVAWNNGTVTHGYTTTQSVFWNLEGRAYNSARPYLVQSAQYKTGYVIGTRGAASDVTLVPPREDFPTPPEDMLEGEGQGETLEPQSLYLAQRALRAPQAPLPPPLPKVRMAWESGAVTNRVEWPALTSATGYRVSTFVFPSSSWSDDDQTATSFSLNPANDEPVYFKVAAKNTQGIVGGASAPLTLTRVRTEKVVADAFVRGGTYSADNFGDSSTLSVKTQSATMTRGVLLKFDLRDREGLYTGRLRLKVNEIGSSWGGGKVYIAKNSWSESTVSWDTRPALVDYIANIAAEPVLEDGWLDFDVTAGILTALASDGYLTLWIEANGDTGDKGYIQFASREAGPASMPHLGLRKE